MQQRIVERIRGVIPDDDVIDSLITKGANMDYYRLYNGTNVYLLGLVTELSEKINALGATGQDEHEICGICVAVCPAGRKQGI